MLDSRRVEMDAIRASASCHRRSLPVGVSFGWLLGTMWAEQYRGIDWPAGHADLLSTGRNHSAGLRRTRSGAGTPRWSRGRRLRRELFHKLFLPTSL